MTKEELLKLYIDTYKAAAKQADDFKPQPLKPVSDYASTGLSNAQNAGGFISQLGNFGKALVSHGMPNLPTWTPPTTPYNLKTTIDWGGNVRGYANRRGVQQGAMNNLNSHLRQGTSPMIYMDGYTGQSFRTPMNMSRDAMLRRINSLKRQMDADSAARAKMTPEERMIH